MELYHIINRGVDKRRIFTQEKDFLRFIHNMFEFNDERRADTASYFFNKSIDLETRSILHTDRELLVDIHAFALMPNHYHLLLSSRIGKGIPRFMHKLNMGYTKYFNLKYKRTGTLFEGGYRAAHIKDESHFIHIPYYIHFNPLDLYSPEWRERKLKDYRKAIKFLENYRWSSHLDYLGKKNFPSITSRDFLLDVFRGNKAYKSAMYSWLKDLELGIFKDYILE
ncbi:MAG: transposase [Parcubacteria group bacterium]|nr:transposase [Parcubacteria group bacterium]